MKISDKKIPIDMWVARDMNNDLFLYTVNPIKSDYHHWYSPTRGAIKIDKYLYPNVKWSDNEPLKIN